MGSNYPKCIDVLAVARSSALQLNNPSIFNEKLKGIRNSLPQEFLETVSDYNDDKIGLIDSEENSESDVSPEEAASFFSTGATSAAEAGDDDRMQVDQQGQQEEDVWDF
jgi:hypothetical protein